MKKQTAIITLTDHNFSHQVLENAQPSVVHFITDWSGSSDIMTFIIDDLAPEYSNEVTFAKIDADKHRQSAMKFGIESVPTLLFFNHGRVVDQTMGMISKSELADKLKALLHNMEPSVSSSME